VADLANRTGICSITLRALPPAELLRVVAEAGLGCIEWGADVHAPPDGPDLDRLRRETADCGVRICSYGSYWRAGEAPLDDLRALVDAARALGARRIRIWAGSLGTADATREHWDAVVSATRTAAGIADDQGCELAFEFHGRTLTDTVDGTLRLLDEVDRPNVSTYWQPPVGACDDEAVAGLERVLDRVSAVHVFSWWPGTTRLRLAERADLWRRVASVLAARDREVDLLLEFVPDDDPALVAGEADTLRALLA
jgi:sugar phosphate isomerase/epimerase